MNKEGNSHKSYYLLNDIKLILNNKPLCNSIAHLTKKKQEGKKRNKLKLVIIIFMICFFN